MEGTRVYGASDDLVEFEGDLSGEVGYSHSGDEDQGMGAIVAFSDGTVLAVRYGKPSNGGVWALDVLRQGEMFDRREECNDEDADPYSDQVFFKPGKLRAWAARDAERVR